MALRDTWHKALVYFGLAEEHDYGPEYEEEFIPEDEDLEGGLHQLGAPLPPGHPATTGPGRCVVLLCRHGAKRTGRPRPSR